MQEKGLENLTPELEERLKKIKEGVGDIEEEKKQFIEEVTMLGINLSRGGPKKKDPKGKKPKKETKEALDKASEELSDLSDGKVKKEEIKKGIEEIKKSKDPKKTADKVKKDLIKKVPKRKAPEWEKAFMRTTNKFAADIFTIDKDLAKGGEGSGIPGHKTYKEKFEDHIKKLRSRLGSAIGEDIVQDFNVPVEIWAQRIMPDETPGMVDFDFEDKPKKIVISALLIESGKEKEKDRVLGHEMAHCLFGRIGKTKGVSEGLAVLLSTFLSPKNIESAKYSVWAMGMVEALKDICEEREIGIRELLKEYHDMDEVSVSQRILNFRLMEDQNDIINDLQGRQEEKTKEITESYDNWSMENYGEEGQVDLKLLRDDFNLSIKRFYDLFKVEKIEKVWSDKARRAAIEARRKHKKVDFERSRVNNATLEDLDFVGKKIEKAFKEIGVEIESIHFAGSRLKGYAKKDSDLDVLVTVKNKKLWKDGREYTNFVKKVENKIGTLTQRNGKKVDLMIHRYHEKDPFTYQPGQKYITYTRVKNQLEKNRKLEKAATAGAISGEPGFVPIPEVYDGIDKPIRSKKTEKKVLDIIAELYEKIDVEIGEEWDKLYGKSAEADGFGRLTRTDTYEDLFGEDFEKGGPGSGIRGHRTWKDKVKILNKLKFFFGSKENYKTFKKQGGVEILGKLYNLYGDKMIDYMEKGSLLFDSPVMPSYFCGAACTTYENLPEVYLRDKTEEDWVKTKKQRRKIIAHELSHFVFGTFDSTRKTYIGGNRPNEGLVEGLAVLHSNLFEKHTGESVAYQEHAIRTFKVLEKYAKKTNSTIPEVIFSLGIGTEEDQRRDNIASFIEFGNRSFGATKIPKETKKVFIKTLKDFQKEMKVLTKDILKDAEINTLSTEENVKRVLCVDSYEDLFGGGD